MSNWKQVIADAKELLDLGAITSEEFEQAKKEAFELRTQITNVGTEDGSLEGVTLPPSSLSGMGTMIGSPEMLDGLNTMGTSIHQSSITKVGSYVLMGEIGKGGMGTAYRARHSIDAFADKVGDVVVKLMHPEFAKNPDFVQRFIGEAALGRTLSHPNFVKIHDIVSDSNNQTLAIVMDLIEGRPLEDVIPENGMSFEEALPIIEQLSLALDYMHEQGVLHRDLKPENIILQPDGIPVILDMGIAKDTTESDLSQTSTGMAMGTPLYMAPEQLDAKNATSAVDRFAFGLIVYQMLSGRLPWEDGLGQGEILAKKFSGNLKPLDSDSKIISSAVMGLLRANAGDRTESCGAFIEELKQSPQGNDSVNSKKRSTTGVMLGKRKVAKLEDVNTVPEGDDDQRTSNLVSETSASGPISASTENADASAVTKEESDSLNEQKDMSASSSSTSSSSDEPDQGVTSGVSLNKPSENTSTPLAKENDETDSAGGTNDGGSEKTSDSKNTSGAVKRSSSSPETNQDVDDEKGSSGGLASTSGRIKAIGFVILVILGINEGRKILNLWTDESESSTEPRLVAQAAVQQASTSSGGSEITLAGAKYKLFDVGYSQMIRVGSNYESQDEAPSHEMSIDPFYMGKHEVTVREYKQCMNTGACSFPEIDDVSSKVDHYCTFYKSDDLPLNCVSWSQASRFCDWAGGRLPTEAEWEYAARSGGKDRRFPWGDNTSDRCSKANVAYGDESNSGDKYKDRRGCGTNKVAYPCTKTSGNTDQGLCDLSGNLWEFTQNCDYNYRKSCSGKVHRGGGFWSNLAQSRSTRRGFSKGQAQMDVGFRCVKPL